MKIRYKTEQILKQSVHRGGYKKHEIVENVVTNFCKIWGIENWKDINNPQLSKKLFRAKLSLIVILSDSLSCASEDVIKYFYIKASREILIHARMRFTELCKINKDYPYLHNECVRLIQNVCKQKKDWFVIKESKYANENKQEKKNN